MIGPDADHRPHRSRAHAVAPCSRLAAQRRESPDRDRQERVDGGGRQARDRAGGYGVTLFFIGEERTKDSGERPSIVGIARAISSCGL